MSEPGLLFITKWLCGGGIEKNIEAVAPWFKQRGYRVKVLSWEVSDEISGKANPVLQTLDDAGVPVKTLPARGPLQLFQRAAHVAAIALRQRFSIVIGYELEANLVAILAKLLLAGRLRAFAQVHNAPNSYSWLNTSTLRLARSLYPWADRIIAVSVRKDAIRFFRLDASLTTTIYNPISLETIRRLSTNSAEDLEGLGPFIMGCGRLVQMKGFPDLIEAFAMVRPDPNLKLVIL